MTKKTLPVYKKRAVANTHAQAARIRNNTEIKHQSSMRTLLKTTLSLEQW